MSKIKERLSVIIYTKYGKIIKRYFYYFTLIYEKVNIV